MHSVGKLNAKPTKKDHPDFLNTIRSKWTLGAIYSSPMKVRWEDTDEFTTNLTKNTPVCHTYLGNFMEFYHTVVPFSRNKNMKRKQKLDNLIFLVFQFPDFSPLFLNF